LRDVDGLNGMRPWILVLLLLTFLTLALGISPSFHECVQKEGTANSEEQNEQGIPALFPKVIRSYAICSGEFATNKADAIIAAFTIIVALATIFLWDATRDLVRGSEETARRQLRAYMGIEKYTISNVSPDMKTCVDLTVRNYGQTPAYDVDFLVAQEIGNPNSILADLPQREERLVIDPGATFTATCLAEHSLTQAQFDGIKANIAPVIVYGVIKYRDAFGGRQRREFRLQHGGRYVGTSRMILSKKGNKAT
jgi:hypothetical protein